LICCCVVVGVACVVVDIGNAGVGVVGVDGVGVIVCCGFVNTVVVVVYDGCVAGI